MTSQKAVTSIRKDPGGHAFRRSPSGRLRQPPREHVPVRMSLGPSRIGNVDRLPHLHPVGIGVPDWRRAGPCADPARRAMEAAVSPARTVAAPSAGRSRGGARDTGVRVGAVRDCEELEEVVGLEGP